MASKVIPFPVRTNDVVTQPELRELHRAVTMKVAADQTLVNLSSEILRRVNAGATIESGELRYHPKLGVVAR